MKNLLDELKGGDRRSIGNAEQVARQGAKNPLLFGDLFAGLLHEDAVIRMRAADALEKVTRKRPELLQPWKVQLLEVGSRARDKEVRWHVAQMLPRLSLTTRERDKAVAMLALFLGDQSSIVKTCSMQALADLAPLEALILIEWLATTGTPAMRSRGRKILKQLQRCE